MRYPPNQGAAWALIFMTVKKRQKKFATKVAKKIKKSLKSFPDRQKKYENWVLKHSVTKKGKTNSKKRQKKFATKVNICQ